METEENKTAANSQNTHTEENTRFDRIVNTGNIKEPTIWVRLILMVIYFVVMNALLPVVAVLSVVQFLFVLIQTKPNTPLAQINRWLVDFYRDSLEFIMHQTDEKPFPFNLETSTSTTEMETVEAPIDNT